MKAKEYADKYLLNATDDQLFSIIKEFILESKNLMLSRNAKTDAALFAILNELNDKWRAFARIVNKVVNQEHIKEDGFTKIIEGEFPFITPAWEDYQKRRYVWELRKDSEATK